MEFIFEMLDNFGQKNSRVFGRVSFKLSSEAFLWEGKLIDETALRRI